MILLIVTGKRLNSFILFIDRTLTSTMILGQSGPGSNDNEGAIPIPQSFRTRISRLDCSVSYQGHLLLLLLLVVVVVVVVEYKSSAEMQSAYSTAPANWATITRSRIVGIIFPKGISIMRNINYLFQDLNSGCWVYFLWW